ncbi:helix-turn-helix transcriptional regulator [Methylocella sp.]|uniref:helix-turn-helix transcriptional regulator n=1 Tax=Methylocella sp. TaxID=1978226 RepID=UPI0037849BC1
MTDWKLGSLAEKLRQAAFDPDVWPEALQALGHSVGASSAAIFSGRARPRRELASPELLEVIEDYVRGGWREQDERTRAVAIGVASGAVVDQDFISRREMRHSAFYEDFLARHNLRWFVGLPLDRGAEAGGVWGVSIHRSASQGPFQPHEVEALRSFLPAISGPATIAAKLGHARVEGLVQALEVIGRPCILLDENGELLETNGPGGEMVGRALDVTDGRLKFHDGASQTAFDAALAEAFSSSRLNAPGVVCVRDRAGERHVLRIVHVGAVARYPFASASFVVIFEQEAPTRQQMLATFRAAFGLTPAEARLARAMLSGRSLAAVARESGLTYETARSYLKAIFLKTGTHRQAELVALLARLRS